MTALLTATVVPAACGIALDKHPRAIETSVSTTTTSEAPHDGGTDAMLYFVLDEALVPAPVQVSDRDPSTMIRELLNPPPKTVHSKPPLRSAIPSGTSLGSATARGRVLIVDLSNEFGNVVGTPRQKAVAQIVLTVTEGGIFQEVRFQIEGKDIQVPSPERGDVSTANACDFAGLLATKDQAGAAKLSQASVDPLDARRTKLEEACPN